MQTSDYARLMAEYNAWMNERLYTACDALGEEARREPRGLFFESLHGTLDHLAWADRMFHNRLLGTDYPITPLRTPVAEDWASLWAVRRELDEATLGWARGVEQETLAADFEMRSVVYRTTRRMPLYVVAVQMFNHQTHHRGQVHAALTQLGVDVGSTDIPFMPFVQAELSEILE